VRLLRNHLRKVHQPVLTHPCRLGASAHQYPGRLQDSRVIQASNQQSGLPIRKGLVVGHARSFGLRSLRWNDSAKRRQSLSLRQHCFCLSAETGRRRHIKGQIELFSPRLSNGRRAVLLSVRRSKPKASSPKDKERRPLKVRAMDSPT
jgi:hypothetical protein